MRSVMSSRGRSRLCAVWTAHLQSPTPFETCSPTTSIPNDMERFNRTPVERIISRINGLASRGGAMQGG